jgi:hypothetical protein
MSNERMFMSVPEAGKLAYGLGRAASYNAMHRGELPALRVGRRWVVPVPKLRALMGLDPEMPLVAQLNNDEVTE